MILGVGVMLCLSSFVLMAVSSGFGCIGGVNSPGAAEGGASIVSNCEDNGTQISIHKFLNLNL